MRYEENTDTPSVLAFNAVKNERGWFLNARLLRNVKEGYINKLVEEQSNEVYSGLSPLGYLMR